MIYFKDNRKTPYFSQKKEQHSIGAFHSRVCSERVIGARQENVEFVSELEGSAITMTIGTMTMDAFVTMATIPTWSLTIKKKKQLLRLKKEKNREADTLSLHKQQCLVKKIFYVHGVVKTFKRQTVEIVLHDGVTIL